MALTVARRTREIGLRMEQATTPYVGEASQNGRPCLVKISRGRVFLDLLAGIYWYQGNPFVTLDHNRRTAGALRVHADQLVAVV